MTNPFEQAMRNAAQARGLMPRAESDEVEATCPNCGTTFEVQVDEKDDEERDPNWQTDEEAGISTGNHDEDNEGDRPFDFQTELAKFRALVGGKRRAEALANPDSDLAKAAAALAKGFAAVFGPRKTQRMINEL